MVLQSLGFALLYHFAFLATKRKRGNDSISSSRVFIGVLRTWSSLHNRCIRCARTTCIHEFIGALSCEVKVQAFSWIPAPRVLAAIGCERTLDRCRPVRIMYARGIIRNSHHVADDHWDRQAGIGASEKGTARAHHSHLSSTTVCLPVLRQRTRSRCHVLAASCHIASTSEQVSF